MVSIYLCTLGCLFIGTMGLGVPPPVHANPTASTGRHPGGLSPGARAHSSVRGADWKSEQPSMKDCRKVVHTYPRSLTPPQE